jgi:hypothetical protein
MPATPRAGLGSRQMVLALGSKWRDYIKTLPLWLAADDDR